MWQKHLNKIFHSLSSTFIHFHLLSSTFIHFHKFSSIFIQFLTTFIYCHSLTSIFIHFHLFNPHSSTFIHFHNFIHSHPHLSTCVKRNAAYTRKLSLRCLHLINWKPFEHVSDMLCCASNNICNSQVWMLKCSLKGGRNFSHTWWWWCGSTWCRYCWCRLWSYVCSIQASSKHFNLCLLKVFFQKDISFTSAVLCSISWIFFSQPTFLSEKRSRGGWFMACRCIWDIIIGFWRGLLPAPGKHCYHDAYKDIPPKHLLYRVLLSLGLPLKFLSIKKLI